MVWRKDVQNVCVSEEKGTRMEMVWREVGPDGMESGPKWMCFEVKVFRKGCGLKWKCSKGKVV